MIGIVPGRKFRALLFLCTLFSFCLLIPYPAPGEGVGEYEIKGAMIANFIRFTTWPSLDTENPQTDFLVGIMGDKAPFKAFSPMQGLRIGNHRLSVRHIDNLYQIPDCRVLFVDRSQTYRIREIIDTVDELPILTIGESYDFIRAGGLISFYIEKGHVKFAINGKTAAKSPVKISSKLMEIGKIIY